MSSPAQAEEPTPGTLDAFVSYARLDADAVFAVVREVRQRWHRTMWVDQDGIPPGAPWRVELGTAMQAADVVVFCLSPRWSDSAECRAEYDRAVALGKRLVPVVFEDGGEVPAALAALQQIDARPGSDPAAVAAAVVTAIDVDHERVREHTEWLSVAVRWDNRGRERALLLRGRDLRAAEAWIARGGVSPAPIRLQHELVGASRRAERRRMLVTLAVTVTTLALTAALAVAALVQRTEAVTQRDQAQSRALAAAAQTQLDVDPERALLLASAAWSRAPTSQALTALRAAVERSRIRVRVAAHADPVSGLVWSADGRAVVSSGRDGTVSAWDAATGVPRGTLRLGPDAVEKIVGSSKGVAIDGQGRAVLWFLDPVDGRLRQRAVLAESGVTDVAQDGDVIALGMADGTVRVLSSSGAARATVRWATTPVRAVALADRGTVLLVSADRGPVATGRVDASRPVVIAGAAVTTQLSADGGTALLAAADGSAGLYATRDGHRIRALPSAFQASMAPAGDAAAVSQSDGQVMLSLAGGRAVPLLGQGVQAADLRFSTDGSQVLAGTLDGVTRVWSASGGGSPAVLRGDGSATQQAVLSPDGGLVATGHNDGSVRIWAVPARPLPLAVGGASGVDFAPDGRSVVTAGLLSATWDSRTGRERPIGRGCPDSREASCLRSGERVFGIELSRAVYSPDGSLIAASSLTGELTFWDTVSTALAARAPLVADAIDDVAFSPDGTMLATAERRGAARLVDPRTGTVTATVLDPRREPVDAVAFTADGSALLTVDDSGVLQRRDHADGATRTLAEIGERPLRMAVDPGGRYLAIGTITRIVLLDATSGRILRTLAGHTGFVTGVAFSRDGNLLFSSGKDGTVRVWDLPSGEQAGLEQIAGQDISYLAVDDTSHRIAAVTTRGDGYILDCEYCVGPDELARTAAAHSTRPFTAEERATFDVP